MYIYVYPAPRPNGMMIKYLLLSDGRTWVGCAAGGRTGLLRTRGCPGRRTNAGVTVHLPHVSRGTGGVATIPIIDLLILSKITCYFISLVFNFHQPIHNWPVSANSLARNAFTGAATLGPPSTWSMMLVHQFLEVNNKSPCPYVGCVSVASDIISLKSWKQYCHASAGELVKLKTIWQGINCHFVWFSSTFSENGFLPVPVFAELVRVVLSAGTRGRADAVETCVQFDGWSWDCILRLAS